jgi:hypothetical protein
MPEVFAAYERAVPMAETGRDSKHSIWVALISAGGVVLAAVIGLFTGVVEVPILSGAPASSDLQATVRELQDKVTRLEQENQELTESLAAAPSSAPEDGAASTPAEFRRATEVGEPVTIGAYTCLDLDSQEPNWGVNTSFNGDLCLNSGFLEGEGVTVFEEEPDKATCEARTNLADSVEAETLLGRFVCLDSDSGYTTRLHVTDVGGDSEPSIAFDIGVWK